MPVNLSKANKLPIVFIGSSVYRCLQMSVIFVTISTCLFHCATCCFTYPVIEDSVGCSAHFSGRKVELVAPWSNGHRLLGWLTL